MSQSDMGLVRYIIVILFSLCVKGLSARQLPVYLEDNHAGSFAFFAQHLDLEKDYTLVLFDAHSDASAIDFSGRIRTRLRGARSKLEKRDIGHAYREEGTIQAYNWIEPLMPQPVSKVLWVMCDELTDEQLEQLENEARRHLDWKLEVDERLVGELGKRFEVIRFKDLTERRFTGPLVVSVDLDFYANMSNPEEQYSKHWSWIMQQNWLECVSLAISRPWLKSDYQANRLIEIVLRRICMVPNVRLQFEPFLLDKNDRSHQAKAFLERREAVPRFSLEALTQLNRDLLLSIEDRIDVAYEAEKWGEQIEKWKAVQSCTELTFDDVDRSIDGAWRLHQRELRSIRLRGEEGISNVRWSVLKPTREVYDALPHVALGKNYTNQRSNDLILYDREWVFTSEEPALSYEIWGRYLPLPNEAGTLLVQAEYEKNGGRRLTSVMHIKVAYRNGFLGALSEQFGVPYIFGIGSVTHQGERAGETLLGNDCANFLIYAFRQCGVRYHWGNPKQLRSQTHFIEGECGLDTVLPLGGIKADDGVVIDFGEHVAALWEDVGIIGSLDAADQVVHHLGGFPEVVTLSELLKKYQTYDVRSAKRATDQITVSFGGDVNLDGIDETFTGLPFENELKLADLAIINLECVVGEAEEQQLSASQAFQFVARADALRFLTRASVDAVTVANNHIYDLGNKGVEETLASLDKSKIKALGVIGRSNVIEMRGKRIGVVGFNSVQMPRKTFSSRVLQYPRDMQRIEEQITALSKECDLVIALPHWGDEYTKSVSDEQKSIAQWLVNSGAEMVVGSHPHVRQKIEYYRGVPVVYSLGNLYFPSKGPLGFNDYGLLKAVWSADDQSIHVGWELSE